MSTSFLSVSVSIYLGYDVSLSLIE